MAVGIRLRMKIRTGKGMSIGVAIVGIGNRDDNSDESRDGNRDVNRDKKKGEGHP